MIKKNWLAALAAGLLLCVTPASAQKYSSFPTGGALASTDIVLGLQGGGCATGVAPCANVKVTPDQIVTYANGHIGTSYGRSIVNATDAPSARTLLGLGTAATFDTVPITNGGTGATSGAAALSALGAQPASANLTTLAGTAPGSAGLNLLATPTATSARAALQIKRPYPSGRWLIPRSLIVTSTGGTAPGTGSMRCEPDELREPVTINAVGVRVITAAASGNVQVALYASDATTLLPTGAALASSASMSTASVATVTDGTFSYAVTTPALYWWCTNSDASAATAAYASVTAGGSATGFIGTSAASSAFTFSGLTSAQTFGTWPDVTSATWADGTSASIPAVSYKLN